MHSQRGFTIVELLVVMAILGVLAAAVMPLGETLLKSRKEHELKLALKDIRTAIDDYKRASSKGETGGGVGGSGYPPSLSALVNGVPEQAPNGISNKQLYFLRQIPRDPFADPQIPAAETWRMRSYASPPNNPTPGADVYDIHSSSNAQALDGSSYAGW